MKLLVTGGCGFIGSNFIHYWLEKYPSDQIINLDKLTYAGHLESLKDVERNPNYSFIHGDISNPKDVASAIAGAQLVVNFAAESHVDRSIIDPLLFLRTNVYGTGVLLNAALNQKVKRFHHISTDEVFGQLGINDPPFDESSRFKPRTPYAASKAASDLLVKSYFETYGLPTTITNAANNFGPYHDPEKLIPRFVTNLLLGKKVPLMGKGENRREWLYVWDHCQAIDLVVNKGQPGETYCVGGEEKSNLEVTLQILKLLGKGKSEIDWVEDRLGHDFRYAIDSSKIKQLGFKPEHGFSQWLEKTVDWYKRNHLWWQPLLQGRPVVDRLTQKKYGQ